jgi:hypothetical protein
MISYSILDSPFPRARSGADIRSRAKTNYKGQLECGQRSLRLASSDPRTSHDSNHNVLDIPGVHQRPSFTTSRPPPLFLFPVVFESNPYESWCCHPHLSTTSTWHPKTRGYLTRSLPIARYGSYLRIEMSNRSGCGGCSDFLVCRYLHCILYYIKSKAWPDYSIDDSTINEKGGSSTCDRKGGAMKR